MTYERPAHQEEVVQMNRRQADSAVGLLIAVVLIIGGILSWQAYRQQRAFDQMGSMMGTSMETVHVTNPLWYVLGTLLVAVVIGGFYRIVRANLPIGESDDRRQDEKSGEGSRETSQPSETVRRPDGAIDPEEQPRSRVLDLLPDDERRVLEPVLTSPGITQIELRDRSNFSKSKVSQTVSALEKRGLLFRERQGRTYRIYPSDEVSQTQG